jgi:phytoene dehydrogenase-like protein
MSLSVSYAPYDVTGGWEQNRDDWGAFVIETLRGYVSNLDDILRDHRVMTTADLEQEFGLLEGNALHGDVTVPHMFDWRPIPGYSDYTTPVDSVYLCSNGTWPANYVSGLPGHNAAHKILADLAHAE